MIFKVRTVYQKEDLRGLDIALYYAKRPRRKSKKVLHWIWSGVWAFLMVMFLMGLVKLLPDMIRMAVALEDRHVLHYITSYVVVMVAVFVLGFRMILKSNVPIGVGLSWRLFKQKGEEFRLCFDMYHFTLERPNVRGEYEYGLILRILEDKERFYLFDSVQSAFILPKRDFEQGTADEFRAFISRTTGKPVEYME